MGHLSEILPNFTGQLVKSETMNLRLMERLGSGAFGVVYYAEDLNTSPGRRHLDRYAVKCLLRHPEDSEQHRSQRREIKIHSSLSGHKNIVKLHQVIEEEFYLFLVLEYYRGGDLYDAIVDYDIFYDNDFLLKKLFIQLLDAVQSLHDRDIAHRDLKPDNIMLSNKNTRIYLGDFGLASKEKRSLSFGRGSAHYMSPECIGTVSGKTHYSPCLSDIWSLGIILANMLTGRNPWYCACPKRCSSFARYLSEGEPYLRRILHLTPPVSQLLSRILAIFPDDRMTIEEIKKAVMEVGTFFPDDDDEDYPITEAELAAWESVNCFSGTGCAFEIVGEYCSCGCKIRSESFQSHRSEFSREVDPPSTLVSDTSSDSPDSPGPATPETVATDTVESSVPPIVLEPPVSTDPGSIDEISHDLGSLNMSKKKKFSVSWEKLVRAIRVKPKA